MIRHGWIPDSLSFVLALMLTVASGCGGDGAGSDGSGGRGDASSNGDVWYGWDAWAPNADAGGGGGGKTDADPGSDAGGADAGGDGVSPDEDASAPLDAVAGDTPGAADTSEPGDAMGGRADAEDGAGLPSALTVTLNAPERWQRGPVTLRYQVAGGAPTYDVNVAFSMDGGATWQDASTLTGYGDAPTGAPPGDGRFVWDSFADVQTDDVAHVRIVATDADGATATDEAGPFILRDAPDRPRVVLVTSAINGNNKVRRLVWTHGTGLSYDGVVHEVGARPGRVVFEPGGRAAAVLQEEARAVSFFAFAADGSITDVVTLPTPAVALSAGVYAGDASMLYVAGYDSTEDAGVWRVATDPWTGLPAAGAVPELYYPRKVVGEVSLLPDGRGLLVHGGTMGDPLGSLRLDALGPDGAVTDWVYFGADGTLVRGLGVAPDGRWAIAAGYNLFGSGDTITLFAVGDDGSLEARDELPVADPDDVEFHSSSLVALVSEAEGNAAFPVRITPEGMLEEGDRVRVSLAEQMTRTALGADQDRFLVTTVTDASGVAIVHLADDGTATVEGTFSLGRGADVIPAGIAVQP